MAKGDWVVPVVLGLLLAGLVFLARTALSGSPRFAADPGMVTLERVPDWMPLDMAQQVAADIAENLRPASLLGSGGLDTWRQSLPATSDWVAEVVHVEPVFPYQAEVAVRLRRPVVAADGVLLSSLGRVLGPGTVHGTLDYGGPLDPEDLTECAAAAGELQPWRETLADWGIAVAGVAVSRDGLVVFTTDRGVEIEWGRSARKSPFAINDLPPRARVESLREVCARYPSLEGVARVQLWKDRAVVVPRSG